ncbi:MAG: NAD(P)-binding protein [bacterium]
MRVGIVGAGISGLYLASLLGEQGHEVDLYDPRTPWEKPCGGGITCRAYSAFPVLNDFRPQCLAVHQMRMIAPDGEHCSVSYTDPILIASRHDLGRYLLEGLESKESVKFLRANVDRVLPQGHGWRLYAGKRGYDCDLLIGADGVNSLVRRTVSERFPKEDTALAVGYWIEGISREPEVVIGFLQGLSGYIWVFPRKDHLSAGIAVRTGETTGKKLFSCLDDFLKKNLPVLEKRNRRRYSALIPSLSREGFLNNRICGGNWALVGDASGFVDPITGEGIYYAFRSAELLSEALSGGGLMAYEEACRRDMVPELDCASSYVHRFYDPRVTNRLVRLAGEHPSIRMLLAGLLAGTQGYLSLKKDLLGILPGLTRDALSGIFRNKK